MNEKKALRLATYAHNEGVNINTAAFQMEKLGGGQCNDAELEYAEVLLAQLKSKDWMKVEQERRIRMNDNRWY